MAADKDVELFLAHHGIKGMHWGVRKERSSSADSGTSNDASSSHKKLKTAAIILGSVAGIALIAGGTYYLAKNGNLPLSSFGGAEKAVGKKFTEETLKPSEHDLTKIVHIAGAPYHPDATFRNGGHPDVFQELKKAGLADDYSTISEPTAYKRYGSNLEKVAVKFPDPLGRNDAVGRPIHHSIILPKQHTADITNFEEAKKKAWSLTKDDYQRFYDYGSDKSYDAKEAKRLGILD